MNNVIVKAARKGEGKTKWLLDVANRYLSRGESVYLLTDSGKEYRRFCDKYVKLYNKICNVQKLENIEDAMNNVVLVEDIFESNLDMNYMRQIRSMCNKLFIAIEGSTEDNEEFTEEYEQLTLF